MRKHLEAYFRFLKPRVHQMILYQGEFEIDKKIVLGFFIYYKCNNLNDPCSKSLNPDANKKNNCWEIPNIQVLDPFLHCFMSLRGLTYHLAHVIGFISG